MEGFQINYADLSDLFWEYKEKIENLIENIDNCIKSIDTFIETAIFTGKTGDAVKSYLEEAHITMLSGIKVTAQTLLDNMILYKDGYRSIDNSTDFKLNEEAIEEFRKKLVSNYENADEYTERIRSALSEVSDISAVSMPDSNGVFDIHEQMDSDLINLVSDVNSYERENVRMLENSVEVLLDNLQSCLSKIGKSKGVIESYDAGSFISDKKVGVLETSIKIFGGIHENNQETYKGICDIELKIKEYAEERETQGIWRTVGGVITIAVGVACIVLTGGAATPIVADIAVNGIKDELFQGNEEAYYITENVFAFAASAMIPIGQVASAGNLTFRSGATIIAKEGISMGAGAGAQKITTDVTGNDTAGMVAGMVVSGVTAAGIEKGANKFGQSKIKNINQEQPYSGEAWKNYFDEKYGAENVKWESEVNSEYINDTDGYSVVKDGSEYTKIYYKVLNTSSADDVNKIFKETMGYEPPYKPGTLVTEIELIENKTFVRVYDKTNSRMQGGWIMRAEDIVGLTPQEIQNKFALPNIPKYVCDVELEVGTRLRTGEVNPLFGFEGGGQQYDLIINGKNVGTFTNERIIGQ